MFFISKSLVYIPKHPHGGTTLYTVWKFSTSGLQFISIIDVIIGTSIAIKKLLGKVVVSSIVKAPVLKSTIPPPNTSGVVEQVL